MTTTWERFTEWLMRVIPDSPTEAWRQRRDRMVKKSKPTYDVYPTAEHRPRVRLVMISGRHWVPVDTEGYDLNELNWRKTWRRDWLMDKILEAFIKINIDIDVEREAKAEKEPRND